MNDNEKLLVEAVQGLLHGSLLGIKELHGDPKDHEHSHNQQFAWSNIQEAFATKILDSAFYDSVRSAFTAVHSHKYIDDPKFAPAFMAEMRSRAIPTTDQEKAIEALKTVVKEALDQKDERSKGWSENLDEIAKRMQDLESEPESNKPFTGGMA